MIEVGRDPGIGCVAKIAGIVTGNVRGVFARGSTAVVATEAGTYHIVVVDPDHRYPGGIAVAILTQVIGRDVSGVFSCGR